MLALSWMKLALACTTSLDVISVALPCCKPICVAVCAACCAFPTPRYFTGMMASGPLKVLDIKEMNRTPLVGTDERDPLTQFLAETKGSVGLPGPPASVVLSFN